MKVGITKDELGSGAVATADTIQTPLRFTTVGSKVIGIPPRLDTPDIRKLIQAVNDRGTLTAEEATRLLHLLYEPDLFTLL